MKRIAVTDYKTIEHRAYPLPWDSDGTCYNFHEPDHEITSDELTEIDASGVETLVIYRPLDDYSFITGMSNLTQLYIYDGSALTDLSFLEHLINLRQLCILGSHITSLEGLKELIATKDKIYKESITEATNPKEECIIRHKYALEGVCIQTDAFDCDPMDIYNDHICRNEIRVNTHLTSPASRMKINREERVNQLLKKKKGGGIE